MVEQRFCFYFFFLVRFMLVKLSDFSGDTKTQKMVKAALNSISMRREKKSRIYALLIDSKRRM